MNEIYIQILESFRKQQKMSVETFIEDITSSRSYYRYINQETDIPIGILLKLIKKMNVSSASFFVHCVNIYKSGMFDISIFLSSMLDKKYSHAKSLTQSIEESIPDYLNIYRNEDFLKTYHESFDKNELDGDRRGQIYTFVILIQSLRLYEYLGQTEAGTAELALKKLYNPKLLEYKDFNDGIMLSTLYFQAFYPHPSLDVKTFLKRIDNHNFFSEGSVGIFQPSIAVLDTLTQDDLKKHVNLYETHINNIAHLADNANMSVIKKHVYKHLANIEHLKQNESSFEYWYKKYMSVIRLTEPDKNLKDIKHQLKETYQWNILI